MYPCVCVFPPHVLPALISRSLVCSLCPVDVSNHMFMQFDQFLSGSRLKHWWRFYSQALHKSSSLTDLLNVVILSIPKTSVSCLTNTRNFRFDLIWFGAGWFLSCIISRLCRKQSLWIISFPSFPPLFLFLLCPVSSAGPNITLEGRYHCYQGPAISLDKLCDFTRDCPLGDDEGDHCREYHCDADHQVARRSASITLISEVANRSEGL